uniref:Uncharacterized protein LOC100376055 n=1 Tax=Saccoglossus kowalevskii TaxID=10224 RepID=A0ABM0M4B7_SACKO|nr:PREDICTED: uncharacterized protein LOC100376055 [Saccoglossus kowalevskii]
MSSTKVTSRDLEIASHEFAEFMLEKWNFGQCGNDVVIFVSRDDNQFSLAIGKEARSILTARAVLKIRTEVNGYFHSGDIYTGLHQTVSIFQAVFLHQYEYHGTVSRKLFLIFIGIGVCLFLFLLSQTYHAYRERVMLKPKHERLVWLWGFT